MSPKTKKKTKKRIKKPVKFYQKPFIRLSLWFLPGLFIGLFVPWYFYLQFIINSLFVDYNWSVPSSIYARELSLYEGKALYREELLYELSVLGYKQRQSVNSSGQFSIEGNSFEIFSRGFTFLDKTEKSTKLSFELVESKVVQLSTPIARLEPLLIGQFYSKAFENRQPIKLAQIPHTMIKGLQAIEDRNFKHHGGVDVFGIFRAMLRNLFAGKIVQGGSTITQQLVKNRLHYRSKSWLRKANEAVSALMLERKFDKGKILQSYFNEIYWGQKGSVAIHGVNQASHYYFSKPPKQLTIAEQALLIAMAKGPSWYHPIKQAKRALNRRNSVLNAWYQTSIIDKEQWRKAKGAPLEVSLNSSFAAQQYQDFTHYLKQQLSKSFTSHQLNQQGLKVFTTVNPYVQYQLQQTLVSQTDTLGKKLQAAAVVSDAQNGAILAIKGSKNSYSFYNRALLSKRQIGSLIKPFVYLAALELLPNFDLSQIIEDKPLKIKTKRGEYWQPKNWDSKSLGSIPAREALVNSRNQATVYLGLKIGVKRFVNFLDDLGLSINRSQHPSVFLGATELSPFEVTNLFLIISSEAKQQHLRGLKYIVDDDNQLIGKIKQQNNLHLSRQKIKHIKSAMHEVTTRGTAAKLSYHFGFENLFGKTGTTNQGKNSWFVGFDKRYLATFWVGKDNNQSTHLSGSSGAMLLWANWYNKL